MTDKTTHRSRTLLLIGIIIVLVGSVTWFLVSLNTQLTQGADSEETSPTPSAPVVAPPTAGTPDAYSTLPDDTALNRAFKKGTDAFDDAHADLASRALIAYASGSADESTADRNARLHEVFIDQSDVYGDTPSYLKAPHAQATVTVTKVYPGEISDWHGDGQAYFTSQVAFTVESSSMGVDGDTVKTISAKQWIVMVPYEISDSSKATTVIATS